MRAPRFQKPLIGARISLAGGRALYVGPGLHLAPHRNLVATVALALETPFTLRMLDGEAQTLSIAVIPPGALHHLVATGPMVFLYLDAMSDDYSLIKNCDLAAATLQIVPQTLDADHLCMTLGIPPRPAPDLRIATIVRQIDARPQDFATVAQAAARAGLSTSRFQSLFRQATGMAFRRYRVWRRMALVLRRVTQGATLTAAALDAGFASSAHLSATFKDMFGIAPSSLLALGVEIDTGRDARAIRPLNAFV